jgi:ribose transport system permease protein
MEGSNALFIPVTLLILLFGVTVGLINGLLVTKRNVPPFIATLGMGIVLKGLRFMWTEGLPKGKVPAILIEIGNGSSFGIPNLFFVFLIIVIAASILLNSTGYGRRLYAVGTNRAAATLNGVKSERVIIMAYIASSVLAAVVGVLMAGYMGMPEPKIGDNKEFESLVAAVLGGVAITGGFGSVQGVVIGVLLMLLVTNLSLLIQVPIQSQYLIIGLLIIFALWINERKKAGAA